MESLLPRNEPALQALVARAQNGDTDAFEELYNQFFAPIYRYTAFRAPVEMVEDLVAEVFVKSWEKLYTYSPRKGVPFGAWLFRIARHMIIDTYRRDRSFEELPEELPDTDALNATDAATRRNDTLVIVRKAMGELPRRYREILVLCYIAELPHEEVSRVLRLTQGAVRILKMRALRRLERLLPPEFRREPARTGAVSRVPQSTGSIRRKARKFSSSAMDAYA